MLACELRAGDRVCVGRDEEGIEVWLRVLSRKSLTFIAVWEDKSGGLIRSSNHPVYISDVQVAMDQWEEVVQKEQSMIDNLTMLCYSVVVGQAGVAGKKQPACEIAGGIVIRSRIREILTLLLKRDCTLDEIEGIVSSIQRAAVS
jgi:hypothetical protein